MKNKKEFNRTTRKSLIILIVIIVISVGFVGCKAAEPEPTPVPPTETPIPPTETPEPTATKTPLPTYTPRPTATEILETPTPDYRFECVPYTMITSELAGESVCVYGEVEKWTSGRGYAAVIRFEDVADAFLVRSTLYYWGGIEEGDCIAVVGEIKWNGTYAYIEYDDDQEGMESIGYYDMCP